MRARRTSSASRPPATRQYDVQDTVFRITTEDGPDVSEWSTLAMSTLDYEGPDDQARIVDGALIIRPKYAIGFEENEIVQIPLGGTGFAVDLPEPGGVTLPGAYAIHDIALDADGLGIDVLMSPTPQSIPVVVYFNPTTGESSTIVGTPAKFIVSGRQNDLYVIRQFSEFSRVRRYVPGAADTPGNYELAGSVDLPYRVEGGAYNDITDELVLVSTTAYRLVLASRDLGSGGGSPFADYFIPDAVPLLGDASVAISPDGERAWVASEGSHTPYGLQVVNNNQVIWEPFPEEIIEPTSLAFDDAGRLYVRGLFGVFVYIPVPPEGWVRDFQTEATFQGVTIGDKLLITCSRTNFDPAVHDTEKWEHIDPAELAEFGTLIPDCPGDLDGNGVVDVADLVALIVSWGPCQGCAADLDGTGVVDVADLVALIVAWGDCR